MIRKFFLALYLSLSAVVATAAIELPAVIGDGMVLQQQSKAALWGHSSTRGPITIVTSWDKRNYQVRPGADGQWRTAVQTPGAGGPFEIKISDGSSVKILRNILIGEVWICSGQSNMEMPVKGFFNQPVTGAQDLLMNAGDTAIRLFTVDKVTSTAVRKDCKGQWRSAEAGVVADFSAVGYTFATLLRQKLKVPVGVIQTAWGGTLIEAWMSKENLAAFPEVQWTQPSDSNKNYPSGLFNGMIGPIAGYTMKGVIWYQGEQNRMAPALYARLMPAMVKEWREKWDTGEWPFYYTQLAPYTYPQDKEKSIMVAWLREVQLKALQTIPNSGMAVTMDIGTETTIHPPDKITVARRLVYLALNRTYGFKGLPCDGPVYKSMTVKNGRVNLAFDNAANGLTSWGQPLGLFELAGEDKIFYPATARITRTGVELRSDSVPKPVAARYAYRAWLKGDLFNTEGLPASSFRTDDWPLP